MKLSHIAAQLRASTASCGLVLLAVSSGAQSAPGNLSDSPLFIGNSVPPNILFLIDDSSSMHMEVLTRDLTNSGAFTASEPTGVDTTVSDVTVGVDDDDTLISDQDLKDMSLQVLHRPECPEPIGDPNLIPPDLRDNALRLPFRYNRILELQPSNPSTTDYCEVTAEEEWRIRTSAIARSSASGIVPQR